MVHSSYWTIPLIMTILLTTETQWTPVKIILLTLTLILILTLILKLVLTLLLKLIQTLCLTLTLELILTLRLKLILTLALKLILCWKIVKSRTLILCWIVLMLLKSIPICKPLIIKSDWTLVRFNKIWIVSTLIIICPCIFYFFAFDCYFYIIFVLHACLFSF